MNSLKESAYKIIKTVASPLRFFAVIAVILCIIIVALSWKSSLTQETTEDIIKTAFYMLMSLIILVAILLVFFLKKLIFDQKAHLTVLREKLGDSELPSTYTHGLLTNISATQKTNL